LHAGEPLAVGFTVEPASSSELVIVPREDWANAVGIDWRCSNLQADDKAFVDIRVLAPPTYWVENNPKQGSRLTES